MSTNYCPCRGDFGINILWERLGTVGKWLLVLRSVEVWKCGRVEVWKQVWMVSAARSVNTATIRAAFKVMGIEKASRIRSVTRSGC
jgi:hypothetical protein